MATPKGEMIDAMLIANGDPTQRAVTNTERGGRKGWIAAQTLGRNLVNHTTQCKISTSMETSAYTKKILVMITQKTKPKHFSM